MPDRYSVRHEEQRASRDADQAEKVAMSLGSCVIDAGVRDDIIAEAIEGDEFEPNMVGLEGIPPGRETWHRLDLRVEGSVSAIHEEISRRSAFLGQGYPFRLDGNNLCYRPSASRFYEYCLSISVAPNITTGEYVRLPRSFERIVALVTRLYMGSHTKSLHTGHPRDGAFGKWHHAMKELHRQSKEWWWTPEEGLPEEPTVGGDCGVDFVVWKQPLDERPGAIFVIGQCACGGDWDTKLDELSIKVLESWFRPLTYVEPIRAFANPFALSDGNFQFAHKRAGWVLDRIRLSAMAEAVADDPEYQVWGPQIKSLIDVALASAA